jgi:hypothetical protein
MAVAPELRALAKRRRKVDRSLLWTRKVNAASLAAGQGMAECYLRDCREVLAIYERQAVLLGLE